MYAGFAVLLLLGGYLYKEAQLRKKQSKQLGLPFGRSSGETRSDSESDKKKLVPAER
jgi:hypothetical protein